MKASSLLITNLIFYVAVAPMLSSADPEWLPKPPSAWYQRYDLDDVAESQITEISPSMVQTALDMLGGKEAVSVSPSLASSLTGCKFRWMLRRKYVLVRAQYGNKITGSYSISVTKDGDGLWVGHLSLGEPSVPTKTALIVLLKKVPSEVYGTCSFAR